MLLILEYKELSCMNFHLTDYVKRLFEELVNRTEGSITEAQQPTPKPLSSIYERPDKDDALKMMVSRFKHDA